MLKTAKQSKNQIGHIQYEIKNYLKSPVSA